MPGLVRNPSQLWRRSTRTATKKALPKLDVPKLAVEAVAKPAQRREQAHRTKVLATDLSRVALRTYLQTQKILLDERITDDSQPLVSYFVQCWTSCFVPTLPRTELTTFQAGKIIMSATRLDS